MFSLSFNVFCPEHSDCEEPISVITEILAENDPLKFENISNEFDKLGFTKVKDLAGATFEKASLVKLSGDPLLELYGAMEIYNQNQNNLLKFAKSEHKNGNFINTQKICKVLLIRKPTDLNVILLHAESFFNFNNFKECIDCLEKAKNIDPKCYKVFIIFELVHSKISNNDLAKQYFFVYVYDIKPFCVDTWTNYADFLFKINYLDSAELAYERILNLIPEFYNEPIMYAKLLLKFNKVKDAKKQFKIAIKRPKPLNKLGDDYYKSGRFKKAILIYKKVLKLEPKNCLVLKNLADIYCRQQNIELSIKTYKKCLKIQPENFDISLELAMINLYNIKDYQEAVIYFKKCIQLNSKRKDLYMKLLAACRLSDNHLKASETCVSLGNFCLKNDEQEIARNFFHLAIHLNPKNAIGHWKIGQSFHKQHLLDLALTSYREAIHLKPNLPNVYCDIGKIHEANSCIEMAMEFYKLAIILQPDHLGAIISLSLLKKKKFDLLSRKQIHELAMRGTYF